MLSDFRKNIPDQHKEIFETLRSYILESNPSLEENIKWNAPNYAYNGQDRITFNFMNKNNKVRIILHKGAIEKEDKKSKPIMDDTSGLIIWNSNIRGTLEFGSIEEVRKKHSDLLVIFKKWLSL